MKKLTLIIFLFILIIPLSHAQTGQEDQGPQYYENAKVVRVKFVTGNAVVQRSYQEEPEAVTANLPVFEGDSILTRDGRVELYLGRLNYLRVDSDSEILLEQIPMLRRTDMRIRILRGSVYFDIAQLEQEKDIEIQTADCGIYVIEQGLYRVDVFSEQYSEVLLFSGSAEVCGNQESRLVKDNQKTVLRLGQFTERPFYFNVASVGDFDQWNRERMDELEAVRYSSSRYLDEGYEDYEYELNRNGRWRYDSSYGRYVWIPYNVETGWRPYSYGRWIYHPFYGNVWSSYHSWGWFTHHYGRWHWSSLYGWYWLPGYYWSPAWVAWYYDPYYYGWCPLSIYNRPVVVINGRWYRDYRYGRGIPLHATSAVVVKKKSLTAQDINKVAVRKAPETGQVLKYRGSNPKISSDRKLIKTSTSDFATRSLKNTPPASGKYTPRKENPVYRSGKTATGDPVKQDTAAKRYHSKSTSRTGSQGKKSESGTTQKSKKEENGSGTFTYQKSGTTYRKYTGSSSSASSSTGTYTRSGSTKYKRYKSHGSDYSGVYRKSASGSSYSSGRGKTYSNPKYRSTRSSSSGSKYRSSRSSRSSSSSSSRRSSSSRSSGSRSSSSSKSSSSSGKKKG